MTVSTNCSWEATILIWGVGRTPHEGDLRSATAVTMAFVCSLPDPPHQCTLGGKAMLDKTMIAMACLLMAGYVTQVDADLEGAGSAQIAAVQQELSSPANAALQTLCHKEFRFEHWIDVGEGVRLHVIERFSGRSVLRFPHRALLMLPATLAANTYFDAEVEGDLSFNALHQAASRGFFGFAMSYEGFGESSIPADGTTVTAARLLDHTGKVVEWIRAHRGVPKVDVFGTSTGAGLAITIAGTESPIDFRHINRVAIATNVYKTFTPAAQAMFTPAFKAFLLGLPGGYFTTIPATYGS